MNRLSYRRVLEAIFDKRLYGQDFFWVSGPPLGLAFFLQALIFFEINQLMLYIYVFFFALLVLVSALGSKNFRREVNNIGRIGCFLFILASALGSLAPFTVHLPSDPLVALLQFALLFGAWFGAFMMAIFETTIFGQRLSLRGNLKLTDEFFKKQSKVWKEKLLGFPNSEEIIRSIDGSRALVTLFDKGSFGLVVLWSCNVMEQTIDAIAKGVISRNPEKRNLFRKPDNSPQRYTKQLEILGFKPDLSKNKEDEQITTEALWHDIRNNIAHHNIKPTFQQTYGAIYILNSFLREMPEILQNWK